MLVDIEIRERLAHYWSVTKLTQEKAANICVARVAGPRGE